MDCLKCGKKTTDEQVFCDTCLASMDAYPVKPDVHIQLPNRITGQAAKKPGRKSRAFSQEEQVIVLRHRVRRLRVLVLLLLICIGILGAMVAKKTVIREDSELGKNYTFVNPFG